MRLFSPVLGAIAITLISGALAGAQVAGGPGIVVAVHDNGTVTVRIGDEEQTVMLPAAKVGDKVVCTAAQGDAQWRCQLHKG